MLHIKKIYQHVSRAVFLVGEGEHCTRVYNRALRASLSCENKKHIFTVSLLLVLSAQCLHNVAHKLKYQLVSRAVWLVEGRKH